MLINSQLDVSTNTRSNTQRTEFYFLNFETSHTFIPCYKLLLLLPENLIVESGFGLTVRLFANGSSSSESEHVKSTTFPLSSLTLSVEDVAAFPELTTSATNINQQTTLIFTNNK